VRKRWRDKGYRVRDGKLVFSKQEHLCFLSGYFFSIRIHSHSCWEILFPVGMHNAHTFLLGNFSFPNRIMHTFLKGMKSDFLPNMNVCVLLLSNFCYKLNNRAMEHIKYCRNTHTYNHKTRETQIYMVHQIWATSTEKQPILVFILSSKLKGYMVQ